MTTVYLGNHDAVGVEGKHRTEVIVPDEKSLGDVFSDITSPGGLWPIHSNAAAPAWVASDNDLLASLIASHFGCEKRDPLPDGEPRDEGIDQVNEPVSPEIVS